MFISCDYQVKSSVVQYFGFVELQMEISLCRIYTMDSSDHVHCPFLNIQIQISKYLNTNVI